MKILYLSEYNEGGGAKSSLNLAIATSKYADVALLGIGFHFPQYTQIHFPETRAKKSISLAYILGIKRTINQFFPDIIHANGMYTGLLAYVLKPFAKSPYRIIMTLRHTSTRMRMGILAKGLIRMLNHVDVIHYLTQYQKELYAGYGLHPKHYRIIPNIIFPHQYPEPEVMELKNKLLSDALATHLIVYVGRIVEEKQLDLFIQVIACLLKHNHNVAGIIVGSGDEQYLEKLHAMTAQLEISSKVIFTGFTTKPELYIRAADFCLFPTLWAEALPRFIIESFSQKRTLVVSNHPSIKGIVAHVQNALIVSEHTIEEYTRNCTQLLLDTVLLKQLEAGAERTYIEQYQSEKVIEQYSDLYTWLLQLKQPKPN
jgi:glycosyltransferase involved in cell wall biosynthesis